MISPRLAFRKLLDRFCPQGWWPVAAGRPGAPRYHPGDFRAPSERAALEICLGAILTQNAAWTNASRAVEALNAAGAVDLERLRRIPRRSLERLIRPSGFFVQKALKLKAFVAAARSRRIPLGRWLRRTPLGPLRRELLSIHGVGPETADSILLYAGLRPVFVVDAYTRRIGGRLGWFPEAAGYDRVQAFMASRLPRSVRLYNEFHALLVAEAKEFCRTKPRCSGCPLSRSCAIRRTKWTK